MTVSSPLSLKLTPPEGNAPDSLSAGIGEPVVVTVKPPALPTVKVAELALVMAGASADRGVGRPLGVKGDVGGKGVGGAVGVGGARAVGGGVPADEAVAGAGEAVGRERRRDVDGLGAHGAGPAVGVEGDGVR